MNIFLLSLLLVSPIKVLLGKHLVCSNKNTLIISRRPAYDFSIELLDRVRRESIGHFVFSPLLTWLQLMNLMEGSKGETLTQLQKTSRHQKHVCFRRKLRDIINKELHNFKSTSIIVIDELMKVKQSFIDEVKRSKSLDVLLLNFKRPEKSAELVNKLIADKTDSQIEDVATPENFHLTYFLMFDAAYYKSSWRIPFNPMNSRKELFYDDDGYPIGHVDMMSQTSVFNFTSVPKFGLDVLELPCDEKNRISMLVFLTNKKGEAHEIFHNLNKTRLASIFNKFTQEGTKTVEVKLPKFQVTTEIENLAELLYDMGTGNIFYVDKANMKGISDFKLHTSMMAQKAKIKINESGLEAGSSSIAENLVNPRGIVQFKANRPFSYMIVDKDTDFILFAGMYSLPDGME